MDLPILNALRQAPARASTLRQAQGYHKGRGDLIYGRAGQQTGARPGPGRAVFLRLAARRSDRLYRLLKSQGQAQAETRCCC